MTSDPGAAITAAEQVASVLEAAERTAEQLRLEAEERLRTRIEEGDRAAELRVSAAEEEAAEILAAAREETSASVASAREEASRILAKAREDAAGLRDDAGKEATQLSDQAEKETARLRDQAEEEAKKTVSDANSKRLEVVGNAQSEADRLRADATKSHEEAAWRAKDLMRGAEQTAAEIDIEGNQVVRDLRELGDSLRANAERLLRDIQTIHKRMVGQIERVEAAARQAAPERGRPRSVSADAGSAPRRRTDRRGTAAGSADNELDVPEFLGPG